MHLRLLTFVALCLCPRLALACWDGTAASSGRVSIDEASPEGAGSWSPARARALADQLTALEAMVPPGYTLEVSPYGEASLCPVAAPSGGACEQASEPADDPPDGGPDDASPPCLTRQIDDRENLVELVASLVHADLATRRRAAGSRRAVYTVQVFASRSASRAEALAARLNDRDNPEHHGFFVEGGFPAWNDWAHVVEGRAASGGRVHRVLAGAFLDRAEAEQAAGDVAALVGLAPLVRLLDD